MKKVVIIIILLSAFAALSVILSQTKQSYPSVIIQNQKNEQKNGIISQYPLVTSEKKIADTLKADNVIPFQIVTPPNNMTVSTSTITISGLTLPYANILINDFEQQADAKGFFSQTVDLDEGENYFTVVAYTDIAVAEKEIIITREAIQ